MTPSPAFVFREFSAEHSIRSAFTQKRRVTELFEHKRWKFGSNFFEKILAKKPTITVGGQHAPQQRTRRLPFYFIHLRLVSLIYWHQENLIKHLFFIIYLIFLMFFYILTLIIIAIIESDMAILVCLFYILYIILLSLCLIISIISLVILKIKWEIVKGRIANYISLTGL